jgi:hypothetical protein
MSDQSKYNINLGQARFEQSPLAIGDHAVASVTVGAAAERRLSPEELAALRQALAQLEDDARSTLPEAQRDAALQKVGELARETVGADEPDVSRLASIGRWFAHHAPELAGGVTSLLLGPQVGALVGTAAKGLSAALFGGEPAT